VRKRLERDCWGLIRLGGVSSAHGGRGAEEESVAILLVWGCERKAGTTH